MRFTPDRIRWPLLVLVVLAALLVAPIEYASTVKVTGQVLPIREWVLARGTEGQVLATLRNHATGAVESYQATETERGDALQFSVSPALLQHGSVQAGDTVGLLTSSILDHQLTQLKGALATTRANLELKRSGEKESVVEATRRELIYAREQVAQQERLVERQRKLHEQGAVSDEELELAESTLRLYQENVARHEAQLEVVRTGSRPEEIEMAAAEVRALEDEIHTLRRRLDRNALVAPFGGPVLHASSADTLLSVADTSTYVVVMPVLWEHDVQPVVGQMITLLTDDRPVARVTRVDSRIRQRGGQPYRLVTAHVDGGAANLRPGTVVPCTLSGDTLSLRQHVQRYFFRN